MSEISLGERIIRWAQLEPSVIALIQIGSRVRPIGQVGGPDCGSDWDFQLVTARPSMFDDRSFLELGAIGKPSAYVNRGGRLGSARKVTAILSDGELDLVIVPNEQLRGLIQRVQCAQTPNQSDISQSLRDQALVLSDGFRILKGDDQIRKLCHFVATSVPLSRIDDARVHEIAEGFVCDYISTLRKIERGEFVAAQRWLHLYLIEANHQLLREVLRRRGRLAFPDGRRFESILDSKEYEEFSISSSLSEKGLQTALDKASKMCRTLVDELLNRTWHWPLKPGC